MDQGTTRRGLRDRGVSSVQFVLSAALSLILFLALANLVVVQYGRGVMRSALEQAVRAGSVTGSAAVCEARAAEVVSQLMGGRMSDDLVVSCSVGPDRVVASAATVFESWTVLTPHFPVSMSAEAVLEWDP